MFTKLADTSKAAIFSVLVLCMALVAAYLIAPASAFGEASRAAEPDFAAIDRYVEKEMQTQRIPGLALGIVKGDRIVHLEGFGKAEPSGRLVTPQTPFVLGSTTKSFTALAIMQLVEAGKVELDAPVQRYLPWFRVADPEASARITVRHLLNQTSGFSTATGRSNAANSDTSEDALEETVRGLRTAQLAHPVGTTFEYSNPNYWTLGLIVQTVSGQSYESYVRQHIFAPLDMRHTFASKAQAQPQGLAMGHRYWFGVPVAADLPDNRAQRPAGFLISNAEDLSHYLSAQLDDGRYGGAQVLSPAGIATLHQPAAREADSDTFYAMGWHVGPTNGVPNGVPTVWHDGSTPTYHSNLVLVPHRQWGVVLLANAEGFPQDTRISGIATGVTNMLVGQEPLATKSDPFILGVYIVVLVLVTIQIIGMIRSVGVLRRWRTQPERRPRNWRGVLRHVVLPLVLNLALALLLLVGLPRFLGAPLLGLTYVFSDLGYTLLVGGVVAAVWGIVRTVLAYLVLRKTGTPSATRASSSRASVPKATEAPVEA